MLDCFEILDEGVDISLRQCDLLRSQVQDRGEFVQESVQSCLQLLQELIMTGGSVLS